MTGGFLAIVGRRLLLRDPPPEDVDERLADRPARGVHARH